jgi:hypothetical protein
MPSGYVIAPQRHVEAVSYWSPTAQQIDEAQNALADLFVHPPPAAKPRMKFPLSDYAVRFHGDLIQGKRVIIAEGYHFSQTSLATLQQEMADPGNIIRQVFGGDALHFHYAYDIDATQVLHFHFNTPK